MTTKEQNLSEWMWKEQDRQWKEAGGRRPGGPGIHGAIEAGAKRALRGEKYDNIYNRADCRNAFSAAYAHMKETLETTVIVCSCCGSKVDKIPGEYRELTQSEINKLKKLPMLPLPGR